MRKAVLLIAALMLLVVPASHAWPACSGNWIQVPAGTKGTASSGIGAVTVEGNVTWQCQNPSPTPTPTSNTNTNSNTNSNSNSNTNKQSQGQGQGQTQGQGQGQQQTANGGAGGSVSGSGNSHNTNTNTATGGNSSSTATGGDSSSTSAANNNGNGSNNASFSSTENVAASKIPVATAYAGTPAPTALCALGYGGGLQFASIGLSGGGARIDQNCAILEAARQGATYAGKLAFCKLYVSNKNVKKAGYTLADCLGDTLNVAPAPEPKIAEVVSPPATTRVLVQIDPNPAPKITPPLVTDQPHVTPAMVPQDETKTLARVGSFHLTTQMSNGACPTKFVCLTGAARAILDQAIAKAKADPSTQVIVEGNLRNAGASARYLAKTIERSRILVRSSDDSTDNVDVYVWQ